MATFEFPIYIVKFLDSSEDGFEWDLGLANSIDEAKKIGEDFYNTLKRHCDDETMYINEVPGFGRISNINPSNPEDCIISTVSNWTPSGGWIDK